VKKKEEGEEEEDKEKEEVITIYFLTFVHLTHSEKRILP